MKQPTEAQKQAGNYPKGHHNILGMRVSIETPAGGERSGVSKAGKLWQQKLNHDYGYIRGTTGRDKDHIDVFLGPNATDGGRNVHVIDQHDPETGEFDEHKVMLGFDDFKDAADAYHSNYEEGWAGGKAITPMSMKDFKAWAFAPGRRLKPAAEHSVARKAEPQELAGGGLVKALKGLIKLDEPVNTSRRAVFGLGDLTAQPKLDLPLVPVEAPKPAPPTGALTQSAQLPSASPVPAAAEAPLVDAASKLLSTPIHRRTVLKQAGASALKNVLPTPSELVSGAPPNLGITSSGLEEAASALQSIGPDFSGVALPGIVKALEELRLHPAIRQELGTSRMPSSALQLHGKLGHTQAYRTALSELLAKHVPEAERKAFDITADSTSGLVRDIKQRTTRYTSKELDEVTEAAMDDDIFGFPVADPDRSPKGNLREVLWPAFPKARSLTNIDEIDRQLGSLKGGKTTVPYSKIASDIKHEWRDAEMTGASEYGGNYIDEAVGNLSSGEREEFFTGSKRYFEDALKRRNESPSDRLRAYDQLREYREIKNLWEGLKDGGYDVPELASGGSVSDEPLPQSFMTEFGTPQPGESTGPAFGVFPQMRRRAEKNNDREGAKDLPIQAARGWAAGTLGMLGDIESLGRMVIPGAADESFFPTSDFYKEWIPGSSKSKTANFGAELGSLMGGVGSTGLVRGAGSAAKAGAKALDGMDLSNSPKLAGALRTAFPGAQPMYAVKPKGGNWTSGIRGSGRGPDLSPATPEGWSGALDYFGVPDMGAGTPVENWLNGPFKKYIANDLGTATDPLLKLEAEGKLHMGREQLRASSHEHGLSDYEVGSGNRLEFAMPNAGSKNGLAAAMFHKAQTGRDYRTPWENLSDAAVESHPASVERNGVFARAEPMPEWLRNTPDDTPFYSLSDNVTDKLGFSHVADYLNEATNAAQELKVHGDLQGLRDFAESMGVTDSQAAGLVSQGLHIDPADLPRTSVADAVRKTAHWNEWMEANRKAAQAKMFGPDRSLREYPDTGHKWVELKNKGEFAAESDSMGHSVRGYEPDAAGGEPNRHYGLGGWDAIQDGRARILSLRGKDGPLATVEIGKTPHKNMDKWTVREALTPEEFKHYINFAESATSIPDQLHKSGLFDTVVKRLAPAKDNPYRITQIKGPGNNPPSQEALAAIQDLVRNGLDDNLKGWSDIRDFGNTGLRKTADIMNSARQGQLNLGEYVSESELQKALVAENPQLSAREILGFLSRYGFAEGGAVQHFEDGGAVGDPGDGGDGIGGEGTGFGDAAGVAASEGVAADQAAALGFDTSMSGVPAAPTGPTSSSPSQGQTAALGSDQSFSGSGVPGSAVNFALSLMLGGLGKGAGMINSLAGNPLGNAFGSSSTGVSSGLNGPGLSDGPSLGGDGGWETAGLSFNPSAPVSAGEINSSLSAAFEPSALGKHSLRVYDPAFTAADARV